MFNFFKKNNEENPQKTNIFQNTGNAILAGFANFLNQDKPFDEFELEDIESNLIRADIGVELAVDIVEKIRKNKITSSKLVDFLKSEFENTLKDGDMNHVVVNQ